LLYGTSFPVSEKILDADFLLPIGKAKIEREGDHVTLVAYSKGVQLALEAAEALAGKGINAEVINLRSLRPLDVETLKKSVKKTHRLVTVEQGWPICGIGAELIAQVVESDTFDYLDSPIYRVTGADIPMPYAQHLEAGALPTTQDVVRMVNKTINRK